MLVLVLCMQVDVKSLKRLLVESIVSVCENIILCSLYALMSVILLTSVFMSAETAVVHGENSFNLHFSPTTLLLFPSMKPTVSMSGWFPVM